MPTSILNRLPNEIQDMFFGLLDLSFRGQYKYRMPPIIVALRSEKGAAYYRALAMFLSLRQTFVLHSDNDYCFGDMKKNAILGITKLELLVSIDSPPAYVFWPRNPSAASVVNVREVTIKCVETYWSPPPSRCFFRIFTQYLLLFKSLEKVTVMFPATMYRDTYNELLPMAIRTGNRDLGTKAKLLEVPVIEELKERWRTSQPRERTWIWMAKEGKFLKKVRRVWFVDP